ncbi:MAG: hypothetical protein IGS39_03190 [Calothrix sp. C42_A2020_038]|nr:hypothetical protein [Calothrix sp. C42_A2020_038]
MLQTKGIEFISNQKGEALSLIDGLLLTLVSAVICVTLPKLLSTLMTAKDNQVKSVLQVKSDQSKSEVKLFQTES